MDQKMKKRFSGVEKRIDRSSVGVGREFVARGLLSLGFSLRNDSRGSPRRSDILKAVLFREVHRGEGSTMFP